MSMHKKFFAFQPYHWVILLSSIIFLFGCWLHYQRGIFGLGPRSLSAQGVDDAFISYRYGWNLAQHRILAWNESGFPKVEGFTNPLWVYLSAFWALLGVKGWIYPLMVLSSSLITALLLVGLAGTVLMNFQMNPVALFGLLVASLSPVTWLHTTSGLESGVFAASIAWLAFLVIFSENKIHHQTFWLVFLTVLVCWLRSDGFVYVGMILLASVISGSQAWKVVLLGILIAGGILLGWRWLNFEAWLPNTLIAKVNFSLLDRLPIGAALLGTSFALSGLPLFVMIGFVGMLQYGHRKLIAGLILLFFWFFYYLYIGGDYFLDRHLVGLIFLCGAVSAPLWVRTRMVVSIALAIVLIGCIWFSSTLIFNRFDYRAPKGSDPWVMLGTEMEKERWRYGVLVTSMAGKIPFFAGGDCIDSWGLNDPDLAKIPAKSFFPGHSSGSLEQASIIALERPTDFFTLSTNFRPDILKTPEMIALWLDTRQPQEKVQKSVSSEAWQSAINSGDDQIWSYVTEPILEPLKVLER
jgi:hypothetical protein